MRQLLGAADAQTAHCHIQHSPSTPTTGLCEGGNDTSRSTGRSGRQKAATRRNMRREERLTVQGPVKKQQPDGMSHRGQALGYLMKSTPGPSGLCVLLMALMWHASTSLQFLLLTLRRILVLFCMQGLIAAGYADRNNATTKAVEKQRMQELAKSKKGQIQAIDEERFQKGLLHSNEEKETDFLRFDEQRRSKRMQVGALGFC